MDLGLADSDEAGIKLKQFNYQIHALTALR